MKRTPEMQQAVNEFWKAIDSICKDYKPNDKKNKVLTNIKQAK